MLLVELISNVNNSTATFNRLIYKKWEVVIISQSSTNYLLFWTNSEAFQINWNDHIYWIEKQPISTFVKHRLYMNNDFHDNQVKEPQMCT